MTRETLTGSGASRETEILNNWLVFEPLSNQDYAISGVLYSVPLGQTHSPQMSVTSGSYEMSGAFIKIQKDIHLFEREQDASIFIRDVGMKNVSLIKDTLIEETRWIEIHLVDYPRLRFSFEIEDLEERMGYKIEVLRSSSFGYEEIPRKIEKDKRGNIVSDTYLKYFDVEVDK